MASISRARRPTATGNGNTPEENDFVYKRPKISELPIASSQRSQIDELINTFKRVGEFDKLRKHIYAQFMESEQKAEMIASLEKHVESEIESQSSLLSKDRKIAAALIEGSAERSDIYKPIISAIENFALEYQDKAEDAFRDFRTKEIGIEAAEEELQKGSKSDEQYELEFNERKEERTQAREEEKERIRKKQEEEKKRKEKEKEEEKRRRREEEEARQRERDEIDAQRRREREEADRERREALEREREARHWRRRDYEDKYRDESYSRDRERDRERDRDTRKRDRRSVEPEPPAKSPLVSEKDLEDIALQELLKEGQMAAKSRQRPELEMDDTLEPPPRRALAPKSIVPRDPVASRLSKLDKPSPKVSTDEQTSRERSPSPVRELGEITKSELREEVDRDSPYRDTRRSHHEGERRYVPRAGFDSWKPGQSDIREKRYDRYEPGRDSDSRRRSRSRSQSRSRRRVERDRESRGSPSPRRRRERSKSPLRRRRSRDRSPEGIDRYMPGRGREEEVDKDKERPKERERERETRGKDREREKDRERDRDDFQPRGDRYVPGENRRDDRRERSRERSRDRERDTRRERVRSRSRDRDRSEDRERRRSRDRRRDRPRDRSRERSRDRDNRDRSKDRDRRRNVSRDKRRRSESRGRNERSRKDRDGESKRARSRSNDS